MLEFAWSASGSGGVEEVASGGCTRPRFFAAACVCTAFLLRGGISLQRKQQCV